MWKRLKRLWGQGERAGDERSGRDHGREPIVASLQPAQPTPAPQPDRMQRALAELDRVVANEGPERAVPSMRDALSSAPTDARVLRRAAQILRALGDEALATAFDQAAATTQAAPLVDLAWSFLAMDDPSLALALADGALIRDPRLRAAAVAGAEAHARLGEHRAALARLDPWRADADADEDAGLAVRWALSAALASEPDRLADAPALPDDQAWVAHALRRAHAFGRAGGDDARQRLLFTLYGALLLDDAHDGERLEPRRLGRWMRALATLAGELLDPETRPAWLSPRGEVLARWLGSMMPANAAIPLSARLPRQPVVIVLADDADLAALYESKAWFEGASAVFQALKDPAELGSPMADVVGVFRAGVTLPFEGLEAERAADRVPPKMLASELQAAAGPVDRAELEGFLAWARSRAAHLALAAPATAEARIPLAGDAPLAD